MNGGIVVLKRFNTEGICNYEDYYMADISSQLEQARTFVDMGKYFTIQLPPRYGKTTLLAALENELKDDYIVAGLSFLSFDRACFTDVFAFVRACSLAFSDAVLSQQESLGTECAGLVRKLCDEAESGDTQKSLFFLFRELGKILDTCKRPVVLIIDDSDQASDNQIFMDFLRQLKEAYLGRASRGKAAFLSVILAGVTDIRHLKGKIDGVDEAVNEPWDIASVFDAPMNLTEDGIAQMLAEYEADHQIGMDSEKMAKLIFGYTHGYPYLVSRLCDCLDTRLVPGVFEDLHEAWTPSGMDEALRILLSEDNTLFDVLTGILRNDIRARKNLGRILLKGAQLEYLPDDEGQRKLRMYGFIRNNHGQIVVDNIIFEMRFYKQFARKQNAASAGRVPDGRE